MNKVVPLNNKKFLGAYLYAQNSERIPEDSLFVIGVILSEVLPATIYSAYGGPVPPVVLAGSALAGLIWGLARYYNNSSWGTSRADTGTMPQAPPSENNSLKKAA
jgi:hypothetical protein